MSDTFDPDKYLAEKENDSFDPDSYLAEKEDSGISKTESFLRGAGQEGTFGFSDEILGALKAAKDVALDAPTLDQLPELYEQKTQEERDLNKAAEEANPATYTTGQVAGGVGSFFIPGVGQLGNLGKVAKLAEGASAAQKALRVGKVAALAGTEGALLSGVSGVGHSEAEDVAGMAKDAGDYATSGAAFGAGLPLAGAGIKAVGKGGAKIAKGLYDLIPGGKDYLQALKFGKEGKSLIGDVLPKINKDLEDSVSQLADKLDKSKDASSKQIGKALNELKTSNLNGPELITETENLLNRSRETANEDALKAIDSTQKKLNQYKELVTEYELTKTGTAPSDVDVAKQKWNQKAREEQLSSQLVGENPSITSPEITPEGDYVQGVMRKTLANQEESIKPIIQKVEGKAGERSLIELDPKKVEKIVSEVSPSDAYNLRKAIMEQVVENEKKGNSQAVSVLSKAVKILDDKIAGSLSEEGNQMLTSGKQKFGNIQDMLDSVKSLKNVATESDNVLKKGRFEDVLAKKEAKRKLSGLSESGQDLRAALESQAKDYGFSPEINKIIEQTKMKDLAKSGETVSALSTGGMLLGPVHSALIKSHNLAGLGQAELSRIASKMTNGALSNTLNNIAQESNPAIRSALIRQFSNENADLEKELQSIPDEEFDTMSDQSSAPNRGPAGNSLNQPTETPFEHLATSEGTALNAPKSAIVKPGKNGIYLDQKGNPTAMYGANLNSSATQKAYKALGIDPYNATEEDNDRVTDYNWKQHSLDSGKALNSMGLELRHIPEAKQQTVRFLLDDMAWRGGPKALKNNQRLVDALNRGDLQTFKTLYKNTNHFTTGGEPRQKSLIEALNKL